MDDIVFYADGGEESRLAEKRLVDSGFEFRKILSTEEKLIRDIREEYNGLFFPSRIEVYFTNTLKRPFLPALSIRYPDSLNLWEAYLSLDGVSSVARYNLTKDFKKGQLWRSIKTFYGMGKKEATCFDVGGDINFQGPTNEAPHGIEKILGMHDYKDWHEVGTQNMGNFSRIVSLTNRGNFVDRKKGLLLFKEEIDKLGKGDVIVLKDHRYIYEVDFEALRVHEGDLIKYVAHMFD